VTEKPPDEEIKAGKDELVMLRYSSSWPKAEVEWTRRRRSSGSQSFPVLSGKVESTDRPTDWAALRTQALEAAGAEATEQPEGKVRPGRSFFSRFLTRS
jgi:hypothetical protein